MIKILADIPSSTNGVDWFRSAGPLSRLARTQGYSIDFKPPEMRDWGTIKSADILHIIRPTSKDAVSAIQYAKDFGVPVIVDMDDDLFDVPFDNPNHAHYESGQVRANLEAALRHADVITASTGALASSLKKRTNAPIHVIPNALDPCLIEKYKPRGKESKRRMVAWRGSNTHARDLLEYRDAILKIDTQESRPDELYWCFIGNPPLYLVDGLKNMAPVAGMDLMKYFRTLMMLQPEIGMVPLHDSSFNRCKSNIACLEMVLAGAAMLVPNWPEWQIPGVVQYNDAESFFDNLNAMVNGLWDLQKLHEASWEHIRTAYDLDRINEERIAVIEALV